jgi:hypothetical protein
MFGKAIFSFGAVTPGGANTNLINLVSDTGVVSTDIIGVGITRGFLAGSMYGAGCAIFGYGISNLRTTNITNLVSNTGVVSADIPTVGIKRMGLAASEYGHGCAIFAYGNSRIDKKLLPALSSGDLIKSTLTNAITLVSDSGVVAKDSAGVGTAREGLAASGFGVGRALFAHGYNGINLNLSNSVSDTGVVDQDCAIVGTSRRYLAATRFGVGQAIFGYGGTGRGECNTVNLVSDTGIISNDVSGVGVNRVDTAAAGYGNDRAIFGFGLSGENLDIKLNQISLVSNTGVVSQDRTTVGSGKFGHSASGYGM